MMPDLSTDNAQQETVFLRDSYRDSLRRLLLASPGWDRPTATRGKATIREVSQRVSELNDQLIAHSRRAS